ncbi:hypothetical protein MYO_610 (plasmid) [Synechocystis sp. PCC 6803]|nr:hypothetical protein MYO_610 [Synechocystis sp. PCC 6803]
MEPQPTVIDGYLHGAGTKYPLSLESPNWKNWLRVHKRFYIASEQGRISVYKINNHWIAQKRVKRHLRQQRLGSTARLVNIPWQSLNNLASAMARDSD